jgi:hypothetical protein
LCSLKGKFTLLYASDLDCIDKYVRLKATGVVDVKNPVEEAFRSGRIEELPDDAN